MRKMENNFTSFIFFHRADDPTTHFTHGVSIPNLSKCNHLRMEENDTETHTGVHKKYILC